MKKPAHNKFYCQFFLYMGKRAATSLNSKMKKKKNKEGNISIVF